jgi:hypothetical protein
MRIRLRYFVAGGVVLGGLVPLLFFTWQRFQNYITTGSGIYLWPSDIMLLATDGREHELISYVIIAISIAVNALLYAALAALLWSVIWLVQRVTARRV